MPKISSYPQLIVPDPENAYVVLDRSVSDRYYRAKLADLNLMGNRSGMIKQETDFEGQLAPFVSTAIGAGTSAVSVSTLDHPGCWVVTASAGGANTGGCVILGTPFNSVLLGGTENFEAIFQIPNMTDALIFLGFFDTNTSSGPTDGAFVELRTGKIQGRTYNNSANSTTSTNYTPSASTWYRAVTIVNSNATRVDFYLYDMAGTLLWTDFLTTNIPTAAGRETSCGMWAIRTTSGATSPILIDWMAYTKTLAQVR